MLAALLAVAALALAGCSRGPDTSFVKESVQSQSMPRSAAVC